jgi:acyl-CoA synthetase (AMP-forming)/AMP-acid ligase II/thioesterase domain-containing protein
VRQESICDLIERRADAGALALLAPGRPPLAYEGLRALMGSVAGRLAERDLVAADRVALVVDNGPEAATAFLSIACAAICAPLNPSLTRRELDFFLQDLGVRAVVVASGCESPVREAARDHGIRVLELQVTPGSPAGVFELDGPLPEPAELRPRNPDEYSLLLHTSGTTSRAKLVPLTQRNLTVSARNVAEVLALRPEDRCLNVMPLFHIHGIVGALLASVHAGGSVVCTPGFHPTRVFEWLREFEPTWFTAVPTMHQGLLGRSGDQRDAVRGHRLRFVRSSSAALPRHVREGLEQTFRIPVIEAYGMTEAAHQIASNSFVPGGCRPGSVGAAAGPEIAILSPEGQELRPGSVGEVAIRGASVFAGYEDAAGDTASFVSGWFRTGDQGVVDGDGFLTLHGRIKELINRGGEKVAPQEVDERLLSHPAVGEAVAFASPDPRLGEEVAAAVVLKDGHQIDEAGLQDFLVQSLAPFKVPRKILIVDEIPKGPTGKVQRVGLADRLGISTGHRVGPIGHVEPLDGFERSLAVIWQDVLGVPAVGRDDDFFALGGDSILGAEAVARIRELTGQNDLPLVSIVRAPTVAAMARELDRGVSALTRSGPILLRPDAAGSPFFFIHGGDGTVLGFMALAQAIGPACSFYGLRARGIDDGGQPHTSIEEMAASYVANIRTVQPRGPYRIGGFCLGASVAIEMAHLLETAGEGVTLVLVDPRLPRPTDLRYRLWRAGRRARPAYLSMTLRSTLWWTTRIVTAGKPSAQTRQAKGIETALARIREAYRPNPVSTHALVILGNEHDQYDIPVWHLKRILPNARTMRVPVGHIALLGSPGVELVARGVCAELERSDRHT